MKKIGILTFHNAHNYGAVLQAFALKTVLENMDFAANIINYGKIGFTKRFDFEFLGVKPFLAGMYINFLSLLNADIRRIRFKKFRNAYLGIYAKKFLSKKDLSELSSEYDYIITGSDQVWNFKLTYNDSSYLLDFVSGNCKRISYAASLGMKQIPFAHTETFRNNLSQFDSILVREQTTKVLIEKLVTKSVYQVLDPVYLVPKDKWKSIAISPKHKTQYILCFSIMAELPGMLDFCKQLQKVTGYKIIRVSNPLLNLTFKAKTIATAGPCEFLGLIQNAAFVVTNSFHGTAFSIIFERLFYVFRYNDDKDIRLNEVLSRFNLLNRYANSSLDKAELLNPIDYNGVNAILEFDKQHSIQLLKNSIN